MRHAWLLLALTAGCYGGQQFDWEARAIIALEPQRVPVAAFGAAGPTATWLSIHTDGVDLVYPLAADGDELVLQSAFDGIAPSVFYDPYDGSAQLPGPGSLIVSLGVPHPPPPPEVAPGEQPFSGSFELSILGGADPIQVPVRLTPVFDPCRYGSGTDQNAEPIPPAAVPVSTCFGGASCSPFDQDATTVVVPPFTLRIFVQLYCSESTG